MLESLFQIGSIQNYDTLEDLVSDIDKRYKYIIKIRFKINNGEFVYNDIIFEEFSTMKKNKYCLIKGPTNGPAITPTVLVPVDKKKLKKGIDHFIEDIIEKKFNKKLLGSFNAFVETYKPKDNYRVTLDKINSELNNKKETIIEDLKLFLRSNNDILENDKIITITFLEQNNNELYCGDFHPIKETLYDKGKTAFTRYYEKNNIISKGLKDKTCYFCNEKKEEVWGYACPYTFYTVDKSSFITGGFKTENSWKNYPVCPDCSIKLHLGAKYADDNLEFKFAGYNYLLLPQLIFFNEKQMDIILKRISDYGTFSTSENDRSKIDRIEEYLLRKLGQEENIINFNFLFFEKSNSAFNILMLIQDLPPTRMKHIIEVKDKVDDEFKWMLNPIQIKNDKIDFNFHFSFIVEFFKGGKYDLDFDKQCLSILRNIFYLKDISYYLLLDRFLSKIRISFINKEELTTKIYVLKAFKIILFLDELGILERRNFHMNMENYPMDDFIQKFNILDSPLKRALFLEGILATKLLNIQFSEKNSKPFYSRLNGLRIDEKIAKRLLPEMINKLEEYDKNYYKELEHAISYYFANADFKGYTVDELSFYFALGLSLSNQYKFDKETN